MAFFFGEIFSAPEPRLTPMALRGFGMTGRGGLFAAEEDSVGALFVFWTRCGGRTIKLGAMIATDMFCWCE